MTDERMDRRQFLDCAARGWAGACLAAGVAGSAVGATTEPAEPLDWRNRRDTMAYQRLGRTNFMSSRVVFGAGGLYSREKSLRLIEMAIERGVNNIDTGRPYKGSEAAIAPVLKKYAGKLWVTSKAGHLGWPDMQIKPGEDAKAAQLYAAQLDESLKALGVDHIDCYMVQGVEAEWVVTMEGLYEAFRKAKRAGKVSHYGLATHTNVAKVVALAAKTGWYDVIMLGVTPASLGDLIPTLDVARKAGIGIVSMKTAGAIRQGKRTFEELYGQRFAGKTLSLYQRAYAYLLASGKVDAFNSNMGSLEVLEENLAVPLAKLDKAALDRLAPIAVAEAADACRHCGQCNGVCPNGVDVAGVLRYHAYANHYRDGQGEMALARGAACRAAGLCERCGACAGVCSAGIDLPTVVMAVRATLA